MIVKILNDDIKKAVDLVIERSKNEKRIFSPDPNNEPYWHHLVRVYQTLIERGEVDSDLLIAAVLHDSVEDGHSTLDEISDLFNSRIMSIVKLLSETVYTDHNFSGNRDSYFEFMQNHPIEDIRRYAFKIKCSDRYDNLIGISFTNLEKKKQQYLNENTKYLKNFAKEVGYLDLLLVGESVLKGEIPAPDLSIQIEVI